MAAHGLTKEAALTAITLSAAKILGIDEITGSLEKGKDANTYLVKGNLTMHGITKPVTLTAVARTGVNPMSKKNIAGFKITGKLNRSAFGIGGGTPEAIVSDEVLINANAEFAKN